MCGPAAFQGKETGEAHRRRAWATPDTTRQTPLAIARTAALQDGGGAHLRGGRARAASPRQARVPVLAAPLRDLRCEEDVRGAGVEVQGAQGALGAQDADRLALLPGVPAEDLWGGRRGGGGREVVATWGGITAPGRCCTHSSGAA